MKRKILIIVENVPVPFDTRVWKEANALHKNGYEVTVLSPKGKGYESSYELLNGIHIYRHPLPEGGNGALGYVWEYSLALFWEFLFTCWIYLRRGFHVLQGCNPPDTIFLIALPFKLLGVKFIFDHHDVNPELYEAKYERRDLLYKILVFLERLTFRASDVVISTNQSYRDIAMSRGGVRPDDVFVVRNGPELSTFAAVQPNPARKRGKSFLVGYVGNMGAQDGLELVLDVAEYIKKSGRQDVAFTCVGGGPGLAALKKLVSDRGLEEMVMFTGRVPDADLVEILSTADVCVNPDPPCEMNDLSTMIKIMEYMALAKPIVQFDLKEGRFSAQDAALYASHNGGVAEYAEKIMWLLDHSEVREKMGKSGYRRVQEELAWEYSVTNLLAAYERAFRKAERSGALKADAAQSEM
jgi:glycosyltransferase involved in cell wall biosynthesis